MKKPREVKHASDPKAETIVEQVQDFERQTPSRKQFLFESGAEKNSAIPVAPPVGYVKQPSLAERIRAMVRSEHLRAAAESAGFETFEEAEDFNVGDDYDPRSPYELDESDGVPVGPAPAAPQSSSEVPQGGETPGGGGSPPPNQTPPAGSAGPVNPPPAPGK